jgi:hypothetical protein
METGGGASFLARVTREGKVSKIALPDLYSDGALTAASDGTLWFSAAKKGFANAVFLFERRSDGSLIEHGTQLRYQEAMIGGAHLAPKQLVIGANGQPRFASKGLRPSSVTAPVNFVGTVLAGRVHLYPLEDGNLANVTPNGVASNGSDTWVTAETVVDFIPAKGALFQVKPDGRYASYTIPFAPVGITWSGIVALVHHRR